MEKCPFLLTLLITEILATNSHTLLCLNTQNYRHVHENLIPLQGKRSLGALSVILQVQRGGG